MEVLPQHLARTRRFEIVGVAESVEQACRLIEELHPDVLAVDMAANEKIPQQCFSKIGNTDPKCRVVLFNANLDHASLRAALQAGVSGYLALDASVAELAAALEKTPAGTVFFSTSVASLIQSDYLERVPCSGRSCSVTLSTRERTVIQQRCQGRRIKEIASDLGLSPRTVEKHIENCIRRNGGGA